MLEIFVYGPKENGYLEMPQDSSISIESLLEAFDEDLSTGEFSIPFDIPWTEHNRRLLGYPERITNFNFLYNYYTCTVFDNGLPEMQNAKLTLLQKSGAWTYDSGKWSASISGSKGLFGSAIKNKTLRDVDYGPVIRWTGYSSRQFAKRVMTGLENYPFMRFVPVAIENFFDKERKDYDNEFLVKDCANYVLQTSGAWSFDRPKASDPAVAATSSDPEYKDYRTIPFLRLQWVVERVFNHFGYTVEGDWIRDVAFNDLLLFNNRALERYNVTANQDNNRSINLRNHVPERQVSVFLKELLSFFGLMAFFGSDSKVSLVYHKTNLQQRRIAKLDEYLVNYFEASYEEGSATKGYKLNYKWDDTEGYHSDRIKDISDKNLIGTVIKRADLAGVNPGRQLTTDDIAYVVAENSYYVVTNGLTKPALWEPYSEKLDEYIKDDGEENFEYGINPLPQYVEQTDNGRVRADYVGTRLKGSYHTNKGAIAEKPFGLFIFYGKMIPRGGQQVPASFNHNLDTDGTVLEPYSLAWNGEAGLYENFHKDWREAVRNKETVKMTLLMDRSLQYKLSVHNIFEVRGTLFLLRQLNRQVPMGNTVEVEMVAL